MRFVKILLLGMVMVTIFASAGMSQVGCEDLVHSPFDTLKIRYFYGPAGSTVLMPVVLSHDSIVSGFHFLIQYDTTWLTPAFIEDSSCAEVDEFDNCIGWDIDSTYIDYVIGPRFLDADCEEDGMGGVTCDTLTDFFAILYPNHRNVIACNFIPGYDKLDSLLPPHDSIQAKTPIFYLKFNVDPDMPESTLSRFYFYESNIYVYDTVGGLLDSTQVNGCSRSQFSAQWYDQAGDSTVTYSMYPTTDIGIGYYFRCLSTVPVEPTVQITANPPNIVVGNTTTLTWSSTNADSVVVRRGSTRLSGSANGQTSGNIVVSGLAVGSYSFVATAYGGNGLLTTSASAPVTVTSGSGGDEGPAISVSAVQSSYNQGELISFTVTATNSSSSQITLSTSSLPANANFGVGGQVTGMSPLTGTFSWTPDFNQSGLFTIRFNGVDNAGTSHRDVVIQVDELEFDRLFSTSAPGNKPVGGLPGKREVAFPIDLITAQTVYGVQFDLEYPSEVVRVDSFLTSDRIPEYVVYDNIGVTPGTIRVVTFGLNNEPVHDTNTTAIMYAMMTIDSAAEPWGDYWVRLLEGRESVNPDPGFGSLPLVSDSGIVEVDHYGDVNLDRYIDVADVVNIVAYIIGNFGLTDRQFDVADVIMNDSVNVFDLVADINLIYGIEPEMSPAPPAPGVAVMELAYDDLPVGSSEFMTVSSDLPTQVAAVQLEISYDPSAVELGVPRLTDANQKFALRSNNNGAGKMKIVLYHLSPFKTNELIQSGAADLVEIPITARKTLQGGDKSAMRLTEALLSTPNAASVTVTGIDVPLPTGFELSQNYPNPFNPSTTIEYSIPSAERVKLDIFNILGRHVTTLVDGFEAAGDHRVVWDATDSRGQRVATGIYLYRLQVGEGQKSKKMLFLK